MKDRARRPAAGPRRTPAGAKPLRSPAAAPGRALTQRSSLVEHLDDAPAALDEAWAQATGEAIELPHRDELEQRFGRSLQAVQAHAGPATRTLLDALGAAGAAHGTDVLLDRADAPLELVAHEVAHVLQAGLSPVADFAGILPEGHAAELAADQAAESAAPAAPAEAQAMRQGWVALLRTRPAPPATGIAEDSEETPLPAPGEDTDPVVADDTSDDEAPASRRVAARPRAPATAPAPQGTPDTAPTLADEPAAADTGPDAEAAGATRTARPASGRTAAGPDRQQEITALLEQGQATWDDAARTAGRHEVDNCPCSAVRPGERPFARGPPLEVPTTQPIPSADAVQPESVDEDTGVLAADEAVAREVARGPPSAAESSAVDAEQLAEVRSLEREIDEEPAPTVPETPVLEATGAADPAAIDERAGLLAAQADTSHTAALARSGEDFGETRLAPSTDPTLGHDTTLGALEVPDLALHDTLPAATLARVATDGNVGALGRNEVLVARDEDLLQCRETTDLQDRTRAAVDGHIEDNDRTLSAMCTRACRAREQQLATGTTGVAERRTRWRAETDRRVRDRTREADVLARTRGEHVRRVRRDTNERASSRLARGRRQADERWRQARQRASHKTHEGRDDSWWQRGIAWFRSQLARLREWIHDFIDGCRRAIHSLLDAARSAAHAIVDAGHRAVSRTIELTRGALDAIADNLPGELGVIASHWRDDAHSFLDTVQARVDTIAEDLHAGVDTAIDGLTVALDQALTDLEQGLDGAVQALDEALQANPLMALLRRLFPALADLVDSGLEGPMRWAAEHVDAWLQAMAQTVGLDRLTASLEELHQSSACGASDEAAEQQRCEAFNELLQRATGWLDGILQSPAAQAVQARLQASRDAEAERQVDALDDFLGFIGFFVQPLYTAWQAIEGAAGRVMEVLGDVGRTVWRHVAGLLGIDPDVDPLTALRQGVQALWDGVVEATRPLVDGLRAAWQWIRESSPLAPFIDLVAQLPQVWQSLVDFGGQVVDGIGQAMARAAAFFRESVLPLVQSGLQLLGGLLHHAIDIGAAFAGHVFGVLEGLLSWESGLALLDALVHAVQAVLAPVLAALRLFSDCVIAFWHAVADAVSHLLEWIRTFLDICTGIAMALLAPPLSFVTFFAGTVWLYVVPTCCKAPILNFFLDVCIRLVRFLPEPADFLLAAVYNGALGFLEALRSAPDEQKVQAVNLIASIFAGNAELAAGFAVGMLAGIWESTGGTIVFLVQAVAWLAMLPVRLVQWATGLANGTTEEDGVATSHPAAGEPGADGGSEAPGEADDDSDAPLGRAGDPPGLHAPAERPAGEPVRDAEPVPSEGGAGGAGSDARIREAGGEPAPAAMSASVEDAERGRPEPARPADRAEEAASAHGPATDEAEAAEQEDGPGSGGAEAEAGEEEGGELGGDERVGSDEAGPVAIRGPPARSSPGMAAGAGGAPATARVPVTSPGARPARPAVVAGAAGMAAAVPALAGGEETGAGGAIAEGEEMAIAGPAPAEGAGGAAGARAAGETDTETADEEADEDADAASGDRAGDVAGEGADSEAGEGEAAPAAPDLPSIGDFFRQLANEGFTRDDVRGLLDGLRAASRTLVRRLAGEAARTLLGALTTQGAAYQIGVQLGTIAGMVVVELVLAYFTAGASTGVAVARTVLNGSRGVARLSGVVSRLRRAIQPVLDLVARLRRAGSGLLGRVMGWLDNVVQWMSRTLRRFLGRRPRGPRMRGPRLPRARRVPRGPRRPRAPRAGPRRPRTRPRGPRAGPRRAPAARRPGTPRRRPRRRGGGRRPRRRRGRRRRRRRRRRRGGAVGPRVRIAATAAWRAVVALARAAVLPRPQILQAARVAARAAAPGIAIRVATRHLGTHMWTLRVTGRRQRRRATVTRGRAWFGRTLARQARYSAARDQTLRHRRLVETLERRLEQRARVILRNEPDPDRVQERLAPTATRFVATPSPRPLVGIRLDLQPDRGRMNASRTRLVWRYELGPNMATGRVDVGLLPPPYLTGRTHDLTHYLLRTARPAIRNLGPYALSAHRITRMQRFVYQPDPVVWGGSTPDRETMRWRASRDDVLFVPEHRQWSMDQRRFIASPGEAALARRRSRSMRAEVVDLSRAATHRSIVDAIMSHNEARTPRPLRSLNTEERFGGRWLYAPDVVGGAPVARAGSAHIVQRHILGLGVMADRVGLARRAAFAEIVLRGRIVSGPGSGVGLARNATAFASLRDATIAMRGAAAAIRGLWRDLRTELAHRILNTGALSWPVPTPPFDAVRARRAAGAPFPARERPRHLRWRYDARTRGYTVPRAAADGRRPIHQFDPTPGVPLTDLTDHLGVTSVTFAVRPTGMAGAHGWFLYTMYPNI